MVLAIGDFKTTGIGLKLIERSMLGSPASMRRRFWRHQKALDVGGNGCAPGMSAHDPRRISKLTSLDGKSHVRSEEHQN